MRSFILAFLLCLGIVRSIRHEVEEEQQILEAASQEGTAVNLCNTNNGGCSPNAICTMNKYTSQRTCECKKGYKDRFGNNYATKGLACDLIPCSPSACAWNQVCSQKPGEPLRCSCSTDFVPLQGTGALQCAFNPCKFRNVSCSNVGRCEIDAQTWSYRCVCDEGYVNTPNSKDCIKDWCSIDNDCPTFSTCHNNVTGPVCVCDANYEMVKGICEPINPCKTDNGGCSPNAICTMTGPNQRTCKCKKGYQDPFALVPAKKDRVCNLIRCSPNPCGRNQVCSQKPDQPFTCACAPDYVALPGTNLECQFDACKYRNVVCPNGKCQNLPFSRSAYYCNCNPGYTTIPEFNGCVKNWCSVKNGGCPSFSTCRNNVTGPVCTCNTNYEMVNGKCQPIDPCKKNNGGCSPNAVCTNTAPNQRTCQCKKGYSDPFAYDTYSGKKGTVCNLQSCSPYACSANQICSQKPGQPYTCACAPDFVSVPGYADLQCQFDPCKYRNVTCGGNGRCAPMMSSPSRFTCNCNSGFMYPRKADGTFDSTTCVKNWCAPGVNPCGPNSKCSTDGTKATCTCDPFFAPVSATKCEYIDPCKTNNGGCGKFAICQNHGYGDQVSCKCKPGYNSNGWKGNVPICQAPQCNNNACPLDSTCTPNGDDFPTCTCNAYAETVKLDYFPFVECKYLPCKTNRCGKGNCVPDFARKAPYYSCQCNKGYVFDGKTCVVDVCYGYTKCGATADCVVKDGKPTCQCKEGYVFDAKHVCVLNTCNNPKYNKCDPVNAICTPLGPQSVKCQCKAGYRDARGFSEPNPGHKCVPQQCSDLWRPYDFAAPCPATYECKQPDKTKPPTCSCPSGKEPMPVNVNRQDVERCFPEDPCKGRAECGALNRICTKAQWCVPNGLTEDCTLAYYCKCKEGYYSLRTVVQWTARDIFSQGVLVQGDGCFVGDTCKYDRDTGARIPDGNGKCPAGKQCVMRALGEGHLCCPGASPWC